MDADSLDVIEEKPVEMEEERNEDKMWVFFLFEILLGYGSEYSIIR